MSGFLGQVAITRRPILGCRSGDSTVGCSHDHDDDEETRMAGRRRRLAAAAEYACALTDAATYPDDLNCMRDARGNAVCSDGTHYPPGCPHTPPDQYFTAGVTPDVTTNGRIEGQLPAPKAGGVLPAVAGSSAVLPVAIGGISILALVGYFTLR